VSGETEGNVSGWTVDTLNAHYAQQLAELKRHIDQRLGEMDLRYQQRFDAQSLALDAARLAAKEGVDAALASADRAVGKAEIAADKRFESVNEFRKTLADQTATFLPRLEYDSAHDALVSKVDAATDDLRGGISSVENRIGAIEAGLRAQARLQTLSIGALAVAIMLAAVLLTIFRG
jgi:hypothetical protein